MSTPPHRARKTVAMICRTLCACAQVHSLTKDCKLAGARVRASASSSSLRATGLGLACDVAQAVFSNPLVCCRFRLAVFAPPACT